MCYICRYRLSILERKGEGISAGMLESLAVMVFRSVDLRSILCCWVASQLSTISWQIAGKWSCFNLYLMMRSETMKQYLVWYLVSNWSIISAMPCSMRQFFTNLWQDLQLFWSLMPSSTAVSLEFDSASSVFLEEPPFGTLLLALVFSPFEIFFIFLGSLDENQFFYIAKSPISTCPVLETAWPSPSRTGLRGCVSSASSTIPEKLISVDDEAISVQVPIKKGSKDNRQALGQSRVVSEQSYSSRCECPASPFFEFSLPILLSSQIYIINNVCWRLFEAKSPRISSKQA